MTPKFARAAPRIVGARLHSGYVTRCVKRPAFVWGMLVEGYRRGVSTHANRDGDGALGAIRDVTVLGALDAASGTNARRSREEVR